MNLKEYAQHEHNINEKEISSLREYIQETIAECFIYDGDVRYTHDYEDVNTLRSLYVTSQTIERLQKRNIVLRDIIKGVSR